MRTRRTDSEQGRRLDAQRMQRVDIEQQVQLKQARLLREKEDERRVDGLNRGAMGWMTEQPKPRDDGAGALANQFGGMAPQYGGNGGFPSNMPPALRPGSRGHIRLLPPSNAALPPLSNVPQPKPSEARRPPSGGGGGGGFFRSGDDEQYEKRQRAEQKQAYMLELQEQMREAGERKARDKAKVRRACPHCAPWPASAPTLAPSWHVPTYRTAASERATASSHSTRARRAAQAHPPK